MVMSGLVMFIAPESIMQIIVASAFCAIFLLIQTSCTPYEEEAENKVCEWVLWGTSMTLLCAMLIMISDGSCLSQDSKAEVDFIANMILLVNVLVMVMIMWWT